MAEAVSVKDVRHVAQLARLGLTEARALELTKDINAILEHMEVLRRVGTDGVEEAAGVGAAAMPLRPDAGPSVELSEPPESFAPETRDGFFIVPRLASHEDAG